MKVKPREKRHFFKFSYSFIFFKIRKVIIRFLDLLANHVKKRVEECCHLCEERCVMCAKLLLQVGSKILSPKIKVFVGGLFSGLIETY